MIQTANGFPTVWCDPCLEPLIRMLNGGGLETVASCCGHGRWPGNIALADGRYLVIADDFEVVGGEVVARLGVPSPPPRRSTP